MLKSLNSTNIVYAVRELQQMSATNDLFGSTRDFNEKDFLRAIHALARESDTNVARAAISALGCRNPYLSDERAPYWQATVGPGQITGIGKMNPAMRNLGAEMYGSELAAIANSDRPPGIRALGLVRQPELRKQVETWVTDPAPEVRASATLLLADFPGGASTNQLIKVAGDPVAQVRSSVALSIGYAQQAQLAALLDKLLTDFDATVRRAAAMSLLSFSPTNENIAAILRAHLDLKEFDPLFLNALAAANPETFLDKLATAIEHKTNPSNWWGGEIPAFTSWKILFKYLQSKPTEAVRSAKFDGYLDALEKVGNYSSSEPRDIYAFYLQRGLTERAAKYRQRATSDASYDLDYYFKEVDKNPSLYTRQ